MYPDIATALTTAKRWSGADDEFDPDLTVLLTASKSPSSYRPFVVSAYWVATASSTSRGLLWEATGEAKFLKPEELTPLIERLLALQEATDGEMEGIPESWSVRNLRLRLCGCTGEGTIDIEDTIGIGLLVSP